MHLKKKTKKISPILCPITFIFSKVVYIFMDIKHRFCKHSDREHKMQRIYNRDNGKFIPFGWVCPDCGQMQKD